MPVALHRRRTRSRLHSLEFAALAIAACLSVGFLLGLAVAAALYIVPVIFRQPDLAPSREVLIAIPLVAGAAFALAYLPMLVWTTLRSGQIVLRRAEARAPDGLNEKRLANVLEELSLAADLPCPKAAIIDDDFPNAMTAGRGPGDATIVVTTGLLHALNRQELQAVVAHEIAHIADGDIRFMTFMAANTSRLQAAMSSVLDLYNWSWLCLILWPSVGLARQGVKVARRGASRERELLADDTAVALTRDPDALVSALTRIGSSTARSALTRDDISMLFIVDPQHTWTGGDSPPLRERIQRIRQLDPGGR